MRANLGAVHEITGWAGWRVNIGRRPQIYARGINPWRSTEVASPLRQMRANLDAEQESWIGPAGTVDQSRHA